MSSTSKYTSGFSLMELSIVLVIVGLLVGGLLVGKELIRESEIKAVMRELDTINTAINTFEDKYGELPGDCTQAIQLWGADASCPNTPTNNVPKQATCNGDGDRFVGGYEKYRFWQHLANAGLIWGSYSGVTGPGHATMDALIGINVPASRLSASGWSLQFQSTPVSGSSWFFDGDYGNMFTLGLDGGANSITQKPSLTPMEMFLIDSKTDDGKPGTGKVKSWKGGYSELGGAPYCTTTTDPATSIYDTTVPDRVCTLLLMAPF